MTPRRITTPDLVLATHNPGKVREIADLLRPFAVAVTAAGDLGLPEPDETADSFVGNAELKALASATASGRVSLADDSGLVVPAIGGAPGIYSARWAGPSKDFAMAMARVNAELGTGDRRAYFVCALTLAWPDGHVETVEGRAWGTLVWPPRGERGFGFDPMFLQDGHTLTYGEMDPDEKHAISHRADAFCQLVARCFAP